MRWNLVLVTGALVLWPSEVWAARKVDKDVNIVNSSVFKVPISVPRTFQNRLKSVLVFVSEDKGKTWKLLDKLRPSSDQFIFWAPHDGLYWFGLQFIGKNGEKDPKNLRHLRPALKTLVDSKAFGSKSNGPERPFLARFEPELSLAIGPITFRFRLTQRKTEKDQTGLASQLSQLHTRVKELERRMAALEHKDGKAHNAK